MSAAICANVPATRQKPAPAGRPDATHAWVSVWWPARARLDRFLIRQRHPGSWSHMITSFLARGGRISPECRPLTASSWRSRKQSLAWQVEPSSWWSELGNRQIPPNRSGAHTCGGTVGYNGFHVQCSRSARLFDGTPPRQEPRFQHSGHSILNLPLHRAVQKCCNVQPVRLSLRVPSYVFVHATRVIRIFPQGGVNHVLGTWMFHSDAEGRNQIAMFIRCRFSSSVAWLSLLGLHDLHHWFCTRRQPAAPESAPFSR